MITSHPRRLAAVTAVAAAVAVALTACSTDSGSTSSGTVDLSSPAPKGVTITMWHASNDPQSLLDLYKAYEEESGNTIKLIDIPSDTGPTVIQTKWATGDRPDIMEYNPTPQDMKQLNMSQNMLDLSSLPFVKQNTLSGVAGVLNGKTYGAILGPVSVYGVYYNKQALAKAGLTTAPTNEAELKSACTALKAAGVTPIYMAGGSEWPAMMLPGFTYMGDFNANNAYGDAVAAGKTKVNDPDGSLVAGLQMVTDLRAAGCFNSDTATATFEKAEAAVADGSAALTFLPSDNIPDFYKASDAAKVDSTVGFGAFSADKGIPSYGTGPTGSFFVPKTGDAAKERVAVDFIDWATTKGYQQYVDAAQIVPTFKNASASSLSGLYADAAKLLKSGKANIGFNASIPGFGNFGALSVKVLVGQSTAQQAADSFQTFVDQAIAAQK